MDTRRFPANQIPALRFSALLNEEVPKVKLMLAPNCTQPHTMLFGESAREIANVIDDLIQQTS